MLNNSAKSFRRRSRSTKATQEIDPELTECIDCLEKAVYAIRSRGVGLENVRIGFSSHVSRCNDVMKNVIFHSLEDCESTIRLVTHHLYLLGR